MAKNLSTEGSVDVFTFLLSFEGVCRMLLDIDLYVVDDHWELIECQPVWQGKATVALEEAELRTAQIFVGPALDSLELQATTRQSIRANHIFQADFVFQPGHRSYQLPPVPETVWRWWHLDGAWTRSRATAGSVKHIPG